MSLLFSALLASALTLTEFPEGKNAVFSFTFDDGTTDQYEVAAPVLDKYGIKAIFCIVPSRIGTPNHMTWEQVRDLVKRGHALANHTWSHKNLNNLTEAEVEEEIVRGYEAILKETGYAAKTVCYPYNACGSRSDKVIKKHGFQSICWRMDNWGGKFGEEETNRAVEKALKDRAYRYILMHGLRPGGGWAPLNDPAQFEEIVKTLLSHKDVWVAGYEEGVSYRAAYRRAVERRKHETEMLDRYAPHAFNVEVANAGGWRKIRTCGEEVEFKVAFRPPTNTNLIEIVKGLKARIVLDDFGAVTQSVREVDFAFGPETRVKGTLSKPGFLRLRVEVPRLNPCFNAPWQRAVAFEPEKIEVVPNEPKDFDCFWKRAVADCAALPIDAKCTLNEKKSRKDHRFYEISVATLNDRRVYGYLLIPKSATETSPVPLRVQVPGAGMGAWTLWPHAEKGEALLFMTVFPWAPSDDSGDQARRYKAFLADILKKEGCHNYFLSGVADDPRKGFFVPVILGVSRAIDWTVENFGEIDRSKVYYCGESQGGAMGLYLGFVNNTLVRVISNVPAFSDLRCGDAGRQTCTSKSLYHFDDAVRLEKTKANCGYLDTANFAARITKPILFVTGLSDWVCPPATVYGAYGRCPSAEKSIVLTTGHHTSAAGDAHGEAKRFLQAGGIR